MNQPSRLSIFEAFGIELEYMVVDRETLDVRPIADRVLQSAAGRPTSDFECGPTAWSNELALHVLELKGAHPTADLMSLSTSLQQGVARLQAALASHDAILMPSGMHPWMDPTTETQLWPHQCAEIYNAYHAIFDCFTHGWANVQSVHLNLPFANDYEFARLHAAVRLLLPILPALAASSPIVQRQFGPWRDMRMQKVREHCRRVPFLTGDMIPEPIYDEATYRHEIFGGLQAAIAPHDSAGVFDANFLNARGAIARFDRGSVEIRVMDVQEHPAVDIAICVAAIAALKTLVAERCQPLKSQQQVATSTLSSLLDRVSADVESTVIDDADYLRQFGVVDRSVTAGELWRHLIDVGAEHELLIGDVKNELRVILREGCLATRIARAIGDDMRQERLSEVYRSLSDCLTAGRAFTTG
ncbi:Carboxylate-amine ligase YbdK [Rosistilla carotiformis]|uniref:Carboxylate-amine ligase YbdK n=1 Tax=Rosistilla carotiformis TaxID=2528017 RepID=A0A518K0A6_9BACT|nr:glutamate-cysteine ligase family protein [Rosistilla carotiformis]QDV71220.1 Carboxylate-amine ligase YbdK [Rosistilla carotiformis]